MPSRLVFNLSQIGAAHLWFDTFLTMNIIYCSDEAANRIRDAKMTCANLIQKEAV